MISIKEAIIGSNWSASSSKVKDKKANNKDKSIDDKSGS